MPARAPRRPLPLERRAVLLALAGGALPLALALWYLQHDVHDPFTRVSLEVLLVMLWLGFAFAVGEAVTRPLQTLSNLLGALREGDTSIRARGADHTSAMGLALLEMNALTDHLRGQRYSALEATSLLQQVMESIDVALFAFDPEGRLRLVNRNGERLIGMPGERALGREAASLGLGDALAGDTPRLLELALPGALGRWELRRGVYRRDGRPHVLVVLSDLGRLLRDEERQAWLRLIRVLSHEINNSLAPIQSIAGSLQTLIERNERTAQREDDLTSGLRVIESRAQALGRFMHAYARLARLPQPALASVRIAEAVQRAAALETRMRIDVHAGPALQVQADPDQLDQLLINLVRNAADAALETRARAWASWFAADGWLELRVEDEGPGLAETTNLFVPFFTTKPEGTGIGLALSRQIAEAHGGTLTLENHEGAPGCVARVRLPLAPREMPARR